MSEATVYQTLQTQRVIDTNRSSIHLSSSGRWSQHATVIDLEFKVQVSRRDQPKNSNSSMTAFSTGVQLLLRTKISTTTTDHDDDDRFCHFWTAISRYKWFKFYRQKTLNCMKARKCWIH